MIAHVSIGVRDITISRSFYDAALLRPNDDADYYAAFVVDPDGYRIEAYYGKG